MVPTTPLPPIAAQAAPCAGGSRRCYCCNYCRRRCSCVCVFFVFVFLHFQGNCLYAQLDRGRPKRQRRPARRRGQGSAEDRRCSRRCSPGNPGRRAEEDAVAAGLVRKSGLGLDRLHKRPRRGQGAAKDSRCSRRRSLANPGRRAEEDAVAAGLVRKSGRQGGSREGGQESQY